MRAARSGIALALALAAVALLLTPLAQAAPAKFEDSIAQRAQACTSCHGREGRAAADGYYPRLAGKPQGYLYQQLLNFRDGRRHYGLMRDLIDPLSNAYLFELAGYFAGLDLPYPPAQPPSLAPDALAKGKQLIFDGDKGRQLPACVQCHGHNLAGAQPSIPGLLGLPRDYLNGQLGAWRSGLRRAQAPDCMAQIAKLLKPEEINAISHWLAGQDLSSLAQTPKPAPSLPAPLPMQCGGLQ